MRTLLIIATLASFSAFGQTREFYGGLNTSDYDFNLDGITSTGGSMRGSQFGFMIGGKSTNIFGNQKRISPFINFEYNRSNYTFKELRGEDQSFHSINAHSARVSVPVQLRLSKNKKRLQFFVSGAPGLNFTAFQMEEGELFADAPVKDLDVFLNAGAGVLIKASDKSRNSEGFQFSGLTLSANKYIPLSPGNMTMGSSSLDQYQLNVGLRFSYNRKSVGNGLFDKVRKTMD